MKLSDKILGMQFSPIRKFAPIVEAVEAKGKKVYKLNIGQPDIKTPKAFYEAMASYNKDVIAYENSHGNKNLLKALVGYYNRLGVDYTEDDMIITAGGSEAIWLLMTALLNPGDNVIMAEPFYTNYRAFIQANQGVISPIVTTADEGYQYATREKIEAAITPNSKAIIIISPGNPTGKVLTHEEMKLIVDIAIEHDLFIIADEVYREFVYDNKEMSSFAYFKEAEDRLIIVDSISKRFSACGARIGALITKNKDIITNVMKVCQARLCPSTVEAEAAAALYAMDPSYFNDIKAEYEHRRNVAVEALNEIEGIKYGVPEGAFYITAQLPVDDTEKFLLFMLNEFDIDGETTMFAPAQGFYQTKGVGQSDIRIAYILKAEDLKKALYILKEGIKAYNAR